jgi:riboflavin-specific deaminase-like protein
MLPVHFPHVGFPGGALTGSTDERPFALDAAQAWDRLLGVRTERDAEAAGLACGDNGVWNWDLEGSPEAVHLANLYAPLCLAGTRCTFAQLGQSLDSCIATRTGDAVYVTGEEDRLHLHRLRALADAVVVGADTAVADDPRLTVRACAGANPVRVVLDHRGRVPRERRVFTDGSAPTLWVLGCEGNPTPDRINGMHDVDIVRVPCDGGCFSPDRLSQALAERGLGRVLVEGGGVTVSRFLSERALHLLYLTVAPVLLGDGVPGLRFPGTPRMRDALRAPTRRFALGEDTLFELDLRATSLRPSGIAEDQHSDTGQTCDEGQQSVDHSDRDTLRGS